MHHHSCGFLHPVRFRCVPPLRLLHLRAFIHPGGCAVTARLWLCGAGLADSSAGTFALPAFSRFCRDDFAFILLSVYLNLRLCPSVSLSGLLFLPRAFLPSSPAPHDAAWAAACFLAAPSYPARAATERPLQRATACKVWGGCGRRRATCACVAKTHASAAGAQPTRAALLPLRTPFCVYNMMRALPPRSLHPLVAATANPLSALCCSSLWRRRTILCFCRIYGRTFGYVTVRHFVGRRLARGRAEDGR